MSALARLRDPKLWLSLVTLALVLFLVLDESEHAAAPGELTRVHAAEPELAGSAGCVRCHGGGEHETLGAACSSCHTAIGEQLAAGSGFHGRLIGAAASDCGRCHIEHHGDEAQLVDARAFQLAGIPERARFAHEHTQFALHGAHDALDCARCHPHADAERVPRGQSRFLGASQRCASCHADPHDGRFDDACSKCHSQTSFTSFEGYEHAAEFPLSGVHAGLACAACHAKDSARAIEVVGAPGFSAAPRACQDCHASPHALAFLERVAADLNATTASACAACHATLDGAFESGGARMDAQLHAATGFELRGAHARLACARCHAVEVAGFDARFRQRPQDCASCHADPHRGQFGARAECASCHTEEHWKPSAIDAAAHTSFELRGAHAAAACEACHAADAAAARVFRGAPRTCEACHADVHAPSFARQLALAAADARAAGGNCGLCHEPTRFDAVDLARFDHGHWTDFALAGAHAPLACEACHPRATHPNSAGRSFGRVAVRGGAAPADCENCHADVHRGAFERSDAVATSGGSCVRCHNVDGFDLARASFDHAHWTGFALAGAHAAATCEDCHGSRARSAALPRDLGFVAERWPGGVASNSCSACHADVHSFRGPLVADSADCARCHTTESFAHGARASFDHAAWTGFPLAGAHGATACEACHVPARELDALGRRFGRVVGNQCSACHVDVHAGQFERDGRTDCARCHAPERPLGEVRFDHQRDARFALDANHAKLDCAACHKPWPTPDGRSVVRYKPLGVECADCHGVSGKKGG